VRLPDTPLEIREIPGKGRGLCAAADIPAGALIACSPVIVLDDAERAAAAGTAVAHYWFWWEDAGPAQDDDRPPAPGAGCGAGADLQGPWRAAIALGPVSMCNHASPANARFELRRREMRIDLYAAERIPAGAEITIDYDCALWFGG